MNNWLHQDRMKARFRQRRAEGHRAIAIAAPPGAGKSRVMAQLTEEEVANGGKVSIFLHRSMLLEQLSEVFNEIGLPHGIRAAGIKPDFSKPIQIGMTDTLYARAVVKGSEDFPDCTLGIFDEAHQQVGNKAKSLSYGATVTSSNAKVVGLIERGATILGLTGSPVELGRFYTTLINGASLKELRDVKSHLPVVVASPSEIDCEGLTQTIQREYREKDIEERSKYIIGDAYDNWKNLNPSAYPAICFGPSVSGSRYLAEYWTARGVRVAHLDGESCLLPRLRPDGVLVLDQYDSTPDLRQEIMKLSRTGEIAMVMNRFVLREAIDMPWLYHGIFATVFGGLSSYIQAAGRIQRWHEGYDHKLLQCHGGSYWRHGSPNEERDWSLGCTNKTMAIVRAKKVAESENPQEAEGICCPDCSKWRTTGIRCPHCGHSHKRSTRRIMMISGELKIMTGIVNKPKKAAAKKNQDQIWMGVIYGSANTDRPVSSAVSILAARCAKDGVQLDLTKLKHRPPHPDSNEWHDSIRKVFPWAKPRAKKNG